MYKKLFHSCLLGSLSTTAILAEEPGPNQIVQTGGSMGIIFKTSLIILSVACLSACSSSESDSHKKATEDLKKDTNRIMEDIKKSDEIILDLYSSGGQPGAVILEGALVSDNTNTDSRIVVNVQTGKGWRGQRAELSASTIKLKQKLSPSCYEEEPIRRLGRETFVNLGCDLTDRNDLAGLEEIKFEAFSIPYIKAKIVLLCDGSQIEKNITTYICADTVVFGSLKLEMTGSGNKLSNLSIYSNKLVVDGDSIILSKGKDGPYPSMSWVWPSVLISAIAISGNGKIKIDFSGANYAAEEKR